MYYKGGGKSNSVGAITGMSLGSVVFCEINLLNMQFIQECFRRTFAAKDRFHLADLNPPAPQHPVIKEVFEVQNTKWQHWTIDDNPILTPERKQDIYDVLVKNPYLFKRDWLGQRVMPTGVIYSMLDPQEHTKSKMEGQPVEMFFTADGGQSDATSCSCNIVTRDGNTFKMYRVAHYYHSGADTGVIKAMSIYAREIKQFMQWCVQHFKMHVSQVLVDPACRALREELHLIGIQTKGADNNAHDIERSSKGIEVGIERSQSAIVKGRFFLLEVPRDDYDHINFLREIGMYIRKDNGDPIDKDNHSMDEFRYSINYFFRRYGG